MIEGTANYYRVMSLFHQGKTDEARALFAENEAKVPRLPADEKNPLATVSGQVIRTGIFQEKAFTEAFNFKLSLRLLRNPNMAANGRFPTAVGDFKYEITN